MLNKSENKGIMSCRVVPIPESENALHAAKNAGVDIGDYTSLCTS